MTQFPGAGASWLLDLGPLNVLRSLQKNGAEQLYARRKNARSTVMCSDVFKCSYKWCLPISVGMMTYKHWFLHYALLASENDLEKNQLFSLRSDFPDGPMASMARWLVRVASPETNPKPHFGRTDPNHLCLLPLDSNIIGFRYVILKSCCMMTWTYIQYISVASTRREQQMLMLY